MAERGEWWLGAEWEGNAFISFEFCAVCRYYLFENQITFLYGLAHRDGQNRAYSEEKDQNVFEEEWLMNGKMFNLE